jgi:hypothetical protein
MTLSELYAEAFEDRVGAGGRAYHVLAGKLKDVADGRFGPEPMKAAAWKAAPVRMTAVGAAAEPAEPAEPELDIDPVLFERMADQFKGLRGRYYRHCSGVKPDGPPPPTFGEFLASIGFTDRLPDEE